MTDAYESFRVAGTEAHVAYPDTGNAGVHVRRILRGLDYPLLGHGYEPELIVDIGANIGATALYFADAYPWANIFCYEPSPSTYSYLERNARAAANVRTFNFGLSDADAEVKLYLGRSQCLQHSTIPSIEVGAAFEVISVKRASAALQGVIAEGCILKIDTEGCEVPILEDLRPHLALVDVIYLEYHSERDRRRIDELLAPSFSLWSSAAQVLHRGNLAYVSHNVLPQIPELGQWEIRR